MQFWDCSVNHLRLKQSFFQFVVTEEAESVIVFGSSRKTDQEEPIGMYGNGLKSGSMRLGKDMILFTKKDGVLTCLMISRTFYAAENVTQVGVGSIPRLYIDIFTTRENTPVLYHLVTYHVGM